MDDNQLAALLPFMASAIADKIAVYYQVSEDEAIRRLYDSKLYAMLEQEKTKVWHFSVVKLFELYQEEVENGIIDFPDY
ncbi:MAG: hypothetical protein HFJ05_06040 [Eubacterium sp.]|nr:hypothetical protein [Eubacterium sp.]